MQKRKEKYILSKLEDIKIGNDIRELTIKEFLDDNALPYAYYTILNRALTPEDGLKPVQRRILYSMYLDGARNGKMIKAATIAANTMSRYHPHGNSSIEEALARLGQTFAMRVPLIEVQGSVGFLQGDSPAAARYYEACLSDAALELVKLVKDNSVPMTRNFSDTMDEPVLLPVNWPNGIINGTEGIAVGYSSSIPPHNPNEVIDACIARIKGEINNLEDLMKYIKGPDFPTKGEVMGLDGIKDYLETGAGSFIVRGKYEIVPLSRGRNEIVFTELPYQISTAQVMAAIKKTQQDKNKLKDISEVKDLSGMDTGLKLSIYVKAGANPKIVLEELWKNTPCEKIISVNSTVLINNKPERVDMITLIDQFLSFKEQCFVRSAKYRIEELTKEIEKLDGMVSVLLDVDKAIKIIRSAENEETANAKLQKAFKINEVQAKYILQMQLKTLTKSDRDKVIERSNQLKDEAKKLKEILDNDDLLVGEIVKELKDVRKIIYSERITKINDITIQDIKEANSEQKKQEKALAKNIDCYLTLLANNHIIKTIDALKEKPNVPIYKTIIAKSLDNVYLISKNADVIEYNVANIPLNTNTAIELMGVKDDNFSSLIYDKDILGVLAITNKGQVNITKSPIKEGNKLVNLADDEFIIYASSITQEDFDNKIVMILSEDGNLAKFKLSNVRLAGQGSGLINGMNCTNAVGAIISNDEGEIITYSDMSIKLTSIPEIPTTGRGVKGSMLHKPFKDEVLSGMYIKGNRVISDNDTNMRLPDVTGRAVRGEKIGTVNIKYIGN